MRRVPIIPTIIVAAAVGVMIYLGIWQLQRATWKEQMLSRLAAAESLPPLDLDRLAEEGGEATIAFRRATITCSVDNARPSLRAGRSRQGVTGYSHYVPCRPGGEGLAGRVEINAGWSQQPDPALRLDAAGPVSGVIGSAEPGAPVILTADQALGPLAPSAAPAVADIPNNHMAYAVQWFLFAAAAALIYALALRGRRRSVAPPRPSA